MIYLLLIGNILFQAPELKPTNADTHSKKVIPHFVIECISLFSLITASVNGDAVNGDAASESSNEGDKATKKQDIITITGRKENCEAARNALMVSTAAVVCLEWF